MTYKNCEGGLGRLDGTAVAFADSPYYLAKSFEVHPRGIRMRTRWSFKVGAELALDLKTPEGEVAVSGIVVECSPATDEPGSFDLTAFFDGATGMCHSRFPAGKTRR
jgi:hypothetical protein